MIDFLQKTTDSKGASFIIILSFVCLVVVLIIGSPYAFFVVIFSALFGIMFVNIEASDHFIRFGQSTDNSKSQRSFLQLIWFFIVWEI